MPEQDGVVFPGCIKDRGQRGKTMGDVTYREHKHRAERVQLAAQTAHVPKSGLESQKREEIKRVLRRSDFGGESALVEDDEDIGQAGGREEHYQRALR